MIGPRPRRPACCAELSDCFDGEFQRMRILVTDSGARSALAATRSLGGAGHFVVTCGESEPALAGVSRYSRAHEVYPNPASDPQAFTAHIRELIVRYRIEVLLPMTEITTLTLAADPAVWSTGVKWPFADAATVANAANKAFVLRLASEVGVPTPAMIELADAKSVETHLGDLTFPQVIKPARSRIRTAQGWVSTPRVGYALDCDDLRRKLRALPSEVFPVLMQERIEGPGVGVFMCYQHGKRVAVFAHQRLREQPPSGGVSVLCESRQPDSIAVDYADRLLSRINWRGVAMIEFKRSNSDGGLRLMEINGRFWGSLQLAIDAGVDFPKLAVDVATDVPIAPIATYRIGQRSRWFWGDVSAMLLLLLRSRERLNLPSDHPGRWRTLWQFLRFWDSRTRNEVLRRDDRRPFLLEFRQWLSGN
jgi:predicted ATP-grasp superfamily ATP-dependent carboligase